MTNPIEDFLGDLIAYMEELKQTKEFPIWKRSTDTMLGRVIDVLEDMRDETRI